MTIIHGLLATIIPTTESAGEAAVIEWADNGHIVVEPIEYGEFRLSIYSHFHEGDAPLTTCDLLDADAVVAIVDRLTDLDPDVTQMWPRYAANWLEDQMNRDLVVGMVLPLPSEREQMPS